MIMVIYVFIAYFTIWQLAIVDRTSMLGRDRTQPSKVKKSYVSLIRKQSGRNILRAQVSLLIKNIVIPDSGKFATPACLHKWHKPSGRGVFMLPLSTFGRCKSAPKCTEEILTAAKVLSQALFDESSRTMATKILYEVENR